MGSSPPRSPLIEGVLLLDKAAGLTSHDAIAGARRALGVRRIGHLGTLDPFATGLLVLLVGRVTRLAPYIEGEPKVYDATIAFGSETDTDDHTGRPTVTAPLPDTRAVEAAIATLTGSIQQQPPDYSAKQVEGVRAYAAARRGHPLELRSVAVDVHGWELREWRGAAELDVTITCGGGTYIRALARDLGRLASSAAHLSSLRRVRSGPFHVRDAARMTDLHPELPLRSPLEGLVGISPVSVDPEERARITRGQTIRAIPGGAEQSAAGRVVLLDDAGAIVALAERQGDAWAPKVVLADA
jgi:tRNA pseudouridine55 synthase